MKVQSLPPPPPQPLFCNSENFLQEIAGIDFQRFCCKLARSFLEGSCFPKIWVYLYIHLTICLGRGCVPLMPRTRQLKPRCPWTDEWIKKLWSMYTMEYSSAIRNDKYPPFCFNVDGTRGYYAEWSKPIREGQTLYGLINLGNIKNRERE